ncbi:glycosyltransferase [Methylobacillus gramineus]|uniref:glycosyltransferase family 2 protein n=1 Tax=Methylobacillus gramineus TaxID=755169 RepID=UPI001CFF9E59|nr:glycosyltransferase [Methylobacillus gramineus]MCB5184123.1 glycosyltransferase [Methylobacillus gramineus]
MSNLAPVALFTYNRPDHTKRTIEALVRNRLSADTDLLIFSDAAKNATQQNMVDAVRAFIHSIKGFKSLTIIERESNLGLAASIIDGVTTVINARGKVIVLEDDMVTSPYFLQYMNDGLTKYAEYQDVASIHAYVYPISGLPETFFLRGADCWGWATWEDRWAWFEPDGSKLLAQLTVLDLLKKFDFNGNYSFSDMLRAQITGSNNSWAIRWHASTFLLNKLTLYPGKSLLRNIGNDGSGVHCGQTDSYSSQLRDEPLILGAIPLSESEQAFRQFEKFFKKNKVSRLRRLLRKVNVSFKKFL